MGRNHCKEITYTHLPNVCRGRNFSLVRINADIFTPKSKGMLLWHIEDKSNGHHKMVIDNDIDQFANSKNGSGSANNYQNITY